MGMPRLLHPNRKFERITRTIQRQITTGRLTVGQKLPPEREMARRYRIGRVSVREAYRSLEQRGLVIVRRGAEGGTFIAQPDPVVLQESLSLLLGHTLHLSPRPAAGAGVRADGGASCGPGPREPRTSCGSNRPSRATSGATRRLGAAPDRPGAPVPCAALADCAGNARSTSAHGERSRNGPRTPFAGHERVRDLSPDRCARRSVEPSSTPSGSTTTTLAHGRMVQRSELIGQLLCRCRPATGLFHTA